MAVTAELKTDHELVMVKTVCCESYKECGRRCSLCPHRPENLAALMEFEQAVAARRQKSQAIPGKSQETRCAQAACCASGR